MNKDERLEAKLNATIAGLAASAGAQISMDVVFDCEFTRLPSTGDSRPGLISIGCVADNGREFYAELTDTWEESQCSFFTLGNVLPLLQGGDSTMEVAVLAVRLAAWVQGLTDGQVTFLSDAPQFDWPFVQEIFGFHGWPANLVRQCGKAGSFGSSDTLFRHNVAIYDFWKDHGAKRHHALWDARSIRYAHCFAMGLEPDVSLEG